MTPASRWTRDPNMDSILESLIPQAFYEIIWTDDSRRTDRRSVFSFMDRDQAGEPFDQTVWNGRPTVGTQTMPTKNILRLRKLDKAELAGKKREDLVVIDEKAPAPPADEPYDRQDSKPENLRLIPSPCSNRDPHEAHMVRVSKAQGWRMVCPGKEDLTNSADVGVRWQAQMEELLASARGAGNEAMRMLNVPQAMRDPIVEKQVRFRVGVAQAHATAALALAISNGIGDLEPVLARLAKPLIIAVDPDTDLDGLSESIDSTFGGPEGEERFVAAAIKAYRSTAS